MKTKMFKNLLWVIAVILFILLVLILLQPKKENYGLVFMGVYQTVDSCLYKKYDNGVVSTYGNVDEQTFRSVCETYELLPDHVKELFEADNWKIVITGYPIDSVVKADRNNIAVTMYDKKKIYLYSVYSSIPFVLMHETGHVVDQMAVGNITGNMDRWSSINSDLVESARTMERNGLMELEKELTERDKPYLHNTEDANEYFASAFAAYVLLPDTLKEKCPVTYQVVEMVLESVENQEMSHG